jgi:probable HAF family extracellular repeat protein
MRKLKKNTLLLIAALLFGTVAVVWIVTAAKRNKTKAFLNGYEITDLTALGFTFVVAINDKGQVLGRHREGRSRICIWDKQNGLRFPSLPKEVANRLVDAFNNSGQIAGTFEPANGRDHAYIWDANNGLVDLGTLGGRHSAIRAMNDSGQAIGSSRDPSGRWQTFFWDADAGMLALSGGTNDPNRSLHPLGLNNAGTVVGCTGSRGGRAAAIWDRDKGVVRLPIPPGSNSMSMACRISDNGKIAGRMVAKDNSWHVIIWDDPNNYRDLGRMSKESCPYISSINDAGQIIGLVRRRRMFSYRTCVFFFSDETGFVDLGELPRSDPTPSGWESRWPLRSTSTSPPCEPEMNNSGQILNCAEIKDDQYHAFLMTPKKDPKE